MAINLIKSKILCQLESQSLTIKNVNIPKNPRDLESNWAMQHDSLNMALKACFIDINHGSIQAVVMDLASCRFIKEKVGVFIIGPCGTGKSHLAQALGHSAIRNAHSVLFTSASKMLAQLITALEINGYDRHFAKIAGFDLLMIDDFGLKPLKPAQDEDFHDVIAESYERKSTIVTSNLDIPEWTEAFPNRILGGATIERLRHGSYTPWCWRERATGLPDRYPIPLKLHVKNHKKNGSSKGGEKALFEAGLRIAFWWQCNGSIKAIMGGSIMVVIDSARRWWPSAARIV
jgi:hypothetical protein